MRAPLSNFSGLVKQVDRRTLGVAPNIILDKAFPMFWPTDANSEDHQAQERALRRQGVDYIFHDVNPPRRLSGCWSLPRGRYFSLCHDETGNDSNTLVNELNSYLDPVRAGLIMFGDMAIPQRVAHFREQFG